MLSRTVKRRGFTLIEMMAVVFIVSVGMMGILSLILFTSVNAKSIALRLTAAYLAQEGVEIVRNIRDSNIISGYAWDNGLKEGIYRIDYDDNVLHSYNPDQLLKLKINNSDGFYNYDRGDDTEFIREITIKRDNSQTCPKDSCLTVKVEVKWLERGAPRSFSVYARLYNWLAKE